MNVSNSPKSYLVSMNTTFATSSIIAAMRSISHVSRVATGHVPQFVARKDGARHAPTMWLSNVWRNTNMLHHAFDGHYSSHSQCQTLSTLKVLRGSKNHGESSDGANSFVTRSRVGLSVSRSRTKGTVGILTSMPCLIVDGCQFGCPSRTEATMKKRRDGSLQLRPRNSARSGRNVLGMKNAQCSPGEPTKTPWSKCSNIRAKVPSSSNVKRTLVHSFT